MYVWIVYYACPDEPMVPRIVALVSSKEAANRVIQECQAFDKEQEFSDDDSVYLFEGMELDHNYYTEGDDEWFDKGRAIYLKYYPPSNFN